MQSMQSGRRREHAQYVTSLKKIYFRPRLTAVASRRARRRNSIRFLAPFALFSSPEPTIRLACGRNRASGAFHSTKISGNCGSKSNGTEIFRKLVSKISVHLSRLSSFLEIWKFRKFPVPFVISTRYESVPVPLVVKLNYKMAASLLSRHYTRCKMICHSSSLFLIETKTLGFDFLENCGLVVPNFLRVRSPGLRTPPREKFVSFSHKLSRKS